jgi:hypothetical protein
MKIKKSTFKDWKNGSVTLVYAKSIFKKGNEPTFVTWDNFNKADVIKIKETQKAIFNKIVANKLEELKSNFFKNYGNSKVKEELLQMEKEECLNILSLPIPKQKTIITTYWTVFFEYHDLVEIQDYVSETIVKGIDSGYDFIHSPKSKYQETGKIPSQAYAQILFSYSEWLDSNFEDHENKSEKTTTNDEIKLNNPYPLIFKNVHAFNLFNQLNNLTVRDITKIADYAFIFHKMLRDGFILEGTKHKTFISFLNNNYNTDINEDKFPFKNQQRKLAIYTGLLKEFEELI